MIDYTALAGALSRVTYKPGWKFTPAVNYEGLWVHIDAMVTNAYDPTGYTDLHIEAPLPAPLINDERDLLEWLVWRLHRIESHEVREWLHFDGRRVLDPHDGVERT
jgi:hypothetical protein